MRQMGAGTSIAGNVAFKEAATAVADVGVEKARVFILANATGNVLWTDNAAGGYVATWEPAFDPIALEWDSDPRVVRLPATSAEPSFGATRNQTSYIIHRLCEVDGPPFAAGQKCSDASIKTSGSKAGVSAATPDVEPDPQPFYRVTSRVKGPRNTFSIVQVILTY